MSKTNPTFAIRKAPANRAGICPIALILCLMVGCLPAAAQNATDPRKGTITGTVYDLGGGLIPAARIHLVNASTGEEYDTTTDCNGRYQLSNLAPGSYQVEFEANGFPTETKTRIAVCPSRPVVLDPILPFPDWAPPPLLETKEAPTAPGHWIKGTVSDPQGAMVSGARVQLSEWSTRKSYQTATKADGLYFFNKLPASNYCMRIEAKGFNPETIHTIKPGQIRDIRLVATAPREKVQVCSASCPVVTTTYVAPPHPGIALEAHARDFVAGGSPLWLTVTLRNITDHSISIRSTTGANPPFGYEIYAVGSCGCPGWLQRGQLDIDPVQFAAKGGKTIDLQPGETLTDGIDLSKLAGFSFPASYTILVERPDTSNAADGKETRDQPIVRSQPIQVEVLPQSVGDVCN